MSLARAFTKRLTRTESKRPKISAPSLITSTNVASYNAPDVACARQMSGQAQSRVPRTSSSSASDTEKSDTEKSDATYDGHTPTLTDSSSIESSPMQSPSLEKNHLSCYFPAATKPPTDSKHVTPLAPNVPTRAPSHSKKEHERLSRARSFRSSNGLDTSSTSSELDEQSRRKSNDVTPSKHQNIDFGTKPNHPFSAELEKLSEVAEDLEKGSRAAENHVDEMIMKKLDLAKFHVQDYLLEIDSLMTRRFEDDSQRPGLTNDLTDDWNAWI